MEVDPEGNVNISRFGGKIVGIGGFINISQNAKHVVFSGTFTAGGLEVAFADGGLKIKEQVTYSAPFAAKEGRTAIFVTERAVLKSAGGTLEVMEIAPGSDLERDVLRHMAFKPRIAKNLRLMDKHLFDAAPMNLRADLEAKARSVTRGAGFFRRAG